MIMNEPPASPKKKPVPSFRHLKPEAQVMAVVMYVAVMMVFFAIIIGAASFMWRIIRDTL